MAFQTDKMKVQVTLPIGNLPTLPFSTGNYLEGPGPGDEIYQHG